MLFCLRKGFALTLFLIYSIINLLEAVTLWAHILTMAKGGIYNGEIHKKAKGFCL